MLFTDIVASTEQLAAGGDEAWRRTMDDHDRTMERLVAAYRGRIVKSTGDGILATFDGPARAVRCAAELLDTAAAQGITLRAGLHTGEIEIRPTDVTGIAVHIANRTLGSRIRVRSWSPERSLTSPPDRASSSDHAASNSSRASQAAGRPSQPRQVAAEPRPQNDESCAACSPPRASTDRGE